MGEPLWALVLGTNSLTPHVGDLGCSGLPTTAGSPLVHMGSLGPTMLREGRVGAQADTHYATSRHLQEGYDHATTSGDDAHAPRIEAWYVGGLCARAGAWGAVGGVRMWEWPAGIGGRSLTGGGGAADRAKTVCVDGGRTQCGRAGWEVGRSFQTLQSLSLGGAGGV